MLTPSPDYQIDLVINMIFGGAGLFQLNTIVVGLEIGTAFGQGSFDLPSVGDVFFVGSGFRSPSRPSRRASPTR